MALERGPVFFLKPRTQTTAGELVTAGVYDIEASADAGSGVTLTGASGLSAAATLFQVFPNGGATMGSTSGVANTQLANNKGWQVPVRTVMGASATQSRRLRAGEQLNVGVGGTATGLSGSDTLTVSWYKRNAAGALTFIVAGSLAAANGAAGTAFSGVIQCFVPSDIIFVTDETIYCELYCSVLGQTLLAGTISINIGGGGSASDIGAPGGTGIQFIQLLTPSSATTPGGVLIKTYSKNVTGTLPPSGVSLKTPKKFFTSNTGVLPSGGSFTFGSAGDAWVDQSGTGTNNSTSTEEFFMFGATNERQGYFMVDLTSLAGATVTGSATLGIYIDNAGNTTGTGSTKNFAMAPSASAPFVENAITWANKPAVPTANVKAVAAQATATANYQTVTLTQAEMQTYMGQWMLLVVKATAASSAALGEGAGGRRGLNIQLSLTTTGGAGTPMNGALVRTPIKRFTLGNVLIPAAVLVKVDKKLVGSVNPSSGVVFKLIKRILTSTTTPSGVVVKTPIKVLLATVTSTGALVKTAIKRFTAGNVVVPSAVLVKAPKKVLTSATAPAGTLARTPIKVLTSATASSSVVIRAIVKHLTGAVGPTGIEKNTVVKHFTGFFYGPAGSGGGGGGVVRKVITYIFDD